MAWGVNEFGLDMTATLMQSGVLSWTKAPEGLTDASATAASVNYGAPSSSQARVLASNLDIPLGK